MTGISREHHTLLYRCEQDRDGYKSHWHHDIIEIELRHETEKAYLLFDGDKEVWVPKSSREWDGHSKTMQMPEWLAHTKWLI
jgi:hypothetical protein